MKNSPKPAGGRATASGMNFQAGVGVWFAAHLATKTPLGARFGLSATALPARLQFETAQFLDDIQMEMSDGSVILVQCKTRPSLSAAKDSPLVETFGQLASFLLSQRKAGAEPDPAKTAALLAVASDAPRSLDDLEAACRHLDLGASWAETTARVSKKQGAALDLLAKIARKAWKYLEAGEPTDADFATLARLFHVVRFAVDDGGSDRREASNLVDTKLLGTEVPDGTALNSLKHVVDRMMQTGAPADRRGLMQQLRRAGVSDTRSPGYDQDLQLLTSRTSAELQRLARHTRLTTSPHDPIPRECMPELAKAIHGGSLLVIGEPGAGKTGVLVGYAEHVSHDTGPLVFLSVDSLSGIIGRDTLRAELQLKHDLLDVLANWPGSEPGVLIIDALDASRGGPSELVFTKLIEDGLQLLGDRWSIVASIRTFDLKNGQHFRDIMSGEPPSEEFRDVDLMNVRHFLVPRLSANEINSLTQSDPVLSRLFALAPPQLQELLHNVFNLSLAAYLIDRGSTPESIAKVTTQSDLVWMYEDARLDTGRLRLAVAATLAVMIEKRRITVLRSRIHNDAVEDAVQSGVLALAGDHISFAHHVLFDHAASRYYLEWDDMEALTAQVSIDPAIGLLLGPALRFAVEKAWREDDPSHTKTWRLVTNLCAKDDIDPVVTSVALRTAAEGVSELEDVAGLLELLRGNGDPRQTVKALDRLARFVGMRAREPSYMSVRAKTAWAAVARESVKNLNSEYSDGVRFLLMTLEKQGEFADDEFARIFGEAARDLLSFAWSRGPEMQRLATQAIRFVTASYASNIESSRALLAQTLEDQRFSFHAHEETPWLAEGVGGIAEVDPVFALEIYCTIFGRDVSQDGHTWLGGQQSRILPLSSNPKQDYEHGRWHLKRAFPKIIQNSPKWGARIANAIAIATARRERPGSDYKPIEILLTGGRRLSVIEDHASYFDWQTQRHLDDHDDILAEFARYLRECDPDQFHVVVNVAVIEEGACSFWNRILGIGAERIDVAGELLWPIASSFIHSGLRDVVRDAVIFLAAAYASQSADERRVFEIALVDSLVSEVKDQEFRTIFAARALSTIPEAGIVTAEARELRDKFGEEGKLVGNQPHMSFEISMGGNEDVVDSLLERGGADLSQGRDKALRDQMRELEEVLRGQTDEHTHEQLSHLWAVTERLFELLEQETEIAAHHEVERASWGAIGEAVSVIAVAKEYAPNTLGHPSLEKISVLIDRLAGNQYPEVASDGDDDGILAWGNWDVRVYAGASLANLCRRFGDRNSSLIDRFCALWSDPVPTVRLQVVQSLNVLWDVARSKMWELAVRIGREEPDRRVLGFFVHGPLRRLSEPEPERVEGIIDEILSRQPTGAERTQRSRESAEEAIGSLVARLWIGRGRKSARRWIDNWTSDLVRGEPYIWSLVSASRMAFFEMYVRPDDETSSGIQQRAKGIADNVVQNATNQVRQLLPELQRQNLKPEERARAERRFEVATKLIDHVMAQLYFGSGVFRRRTSAEEEDLPGLADREAKGAFLADYSDTLEAIGETGNAHTLHHLIELYGYLADAAPGEVFDRVSELLVGPARREGYHFESLGSNEFVLLIRRYLADHREVFEDAERRRQLLAVLEVFSEAGWPEALSLLYELPDLLR